MPLTSDHLDALSTAVESVLSTEIAEITYAQILDGLPMIDVFRDRYSSGLDIRHPLYQHTALCPGVFERMRKYRAGFDTQSLKYDDKVALPLGPFFHLTVPFLTFIDLACRSISTVLAWVKGVSPEVDRDGRRCCAPDGSSDF